MTCRSRCPDDFTISAPCRIIKAGGGRVQISARELPDFPAGTYLWETTSSKIRLHSANTATVTVEALSNLSSSRGAETITVTRTFIRCPPVVKTVHVTVARVTFSKSTNQRYGYDNYDTPARSTDDHICVKKGSHTFLRVTIEGGALGTDFDFVCDDPSICTPVAPGAVASFDLRLDAGAHNKANTALHAKCKCPSATSFTNIAVHVYKEKMIEVVVAKIHDRTRPGTSLHRPAMNPASHTAAVNAKLKEAVVKFDITNFTAGNVVTHAAFDLDHNDALSYDINAGGGRELDVIKAAMTGTGTKTRIAIVKKLKSYYYLSQAVAIGDTRLTVRGASVFPYTSFPNVNLGSGADKELVTVSSVSGNTITLASGVTKPHPVHSRIEFIAAGWSSDPIILTEENTADGSLIAENKILWSIPHEVGHRKFREPDILGDVNDQTNLMHHQQSWTDYRLRYCPRTRRYPPAGTENQWELITR
jgi:hypothetical protein